MTQDNVDAPSRPPRQGSSLDTSPSQARPSDGSAGTHRRVAESSVGATAATTASSSPGATSQQQSWLDRIHKHPFLILVGLLVSIVAGLLTIITLIEGLRDDGSSDPTLGQGEPCPPTTADYVAEDDLLDREREQLAQVRTGEYVDVAPESFFSLAVLSGQITESELDQFLCLARTVLEEPTDYYVTGERDAITVGSRWSIDIMRTYNRDVFRSVQERVLELVEYLIANRAATGEPRRSLTGVKVKIRGTERFFDLEGLPGSGARTWVAFDLR